ncbi:hypothetical protein PTE30175_00143 [Pandoraea terrae]|uniref:Uncharacterized protein n=1 Tax=Pandoraea terrae TaxID=1537710 RepID=A0A5E4RFE4_9BURK|nr:hypothetical protein [Pandoraea terrae]VVD61905.1 hypothetical protein PTE30175_00143 [Pandoraea terrae]
MNRDLSSSAIATLKILGELGPSDTPPPVPAPVVTELLKRGYAAHAWHGGLVLTDSGWRRAAQRG